MVDSRKTKLEFSVYPAPRIFTVVVVVVEPYISILTTHSTIEYSLTVVSCWKMKPNMTCCHILNVEYPFYTNISRLIGLPLLLLSGLKCP